MVDDPACTVCGHVSSDHRPGSCGATDDEGAKCRCRTFWAEAKPARAEVACDVEAVRARIAALEALPASARGAEFWELCASAGALLRVVDAIAAALPPDYAPHGTLAEKVARVVRLYQLSIQYGNQKREQCDRLEAERDTAAARLADLRATVQRYVDAHPASAVRTLQSALDATAPAGGLTASQRAHVARAIGATTDVLVSPTPASGGPEAPHIEGETLGEYRARSGLPGTDTVAARDMRWRDGRWVREPAAPEAPRGLRDCAACGIHGCSPACGRDWVEPEAPRGEWLTSVIGYSCTWCGGGHWGIDCETRGKRLDRERGAR